MQIRRSRPSTLGEVVSHLFDTEEFQVRFLKRRPICIMARCHVRIKRSGTSSRNLVVSIFQFAVSTRSARNRT